MIFNSILGLFSTDLAIDLGTANTLVYMRGRGVVAREPSVLAVQRDGRGHRKVLAVGNSAKKMLGRTHADIEAIRPLRGGVIADFEITEEMLRHFILMAHKRSSLVAPRIVICIPFGITEVERRAVRESAESAGAREVYLIEEPLAAAIGANLPIVEPTGNMIVDIGGGTTEVAVISLSGIVVSCSIKIGGDTMDEAIIQYIRRKYNVLVGEQTAERVKIRLGNAFPYDDEEMDSIAVKGRDMIKGVPRELTITAAEVRESLREDVGHIVEAVLQTLERTPPELASDIIDKGIVLTGGGALLKNLDVLLREATGVPVMVCDDPLSAVVMGSGKALEELDLLRNITNA